ncbi:hypothetical protein HYQ44_012218 [Verticillium longisporum]|nr:hypothetical protein HYQ44_012218 [Verticillium longisporum]
MPLHAPRTSSSHGQVRSPSARTHNHAKTKKRNSSSTMASASTKLGEIGASHHTRPEIRLRRRMACIGLDHPSPHVIDPSQN